MCITVENIAGDTNYQPLGKIVSLPYLLNARHTDAAIWHTVASIYIVATSGYAWNSDSLGDTNYPHLG